jgi:hypothetical protein
MSDLVRELHRDPTFAIAQLGPVMFAAWHEAPTGAQMRVLEACSRSMTDRHPTGTAFIDMIVRGRPTFSSEVRDAVVALTRDPTLFPLGTAHVVLLGGFAGATIRAFLGTALLVAKAASPVRVFGDLAGVPAWLGPAFAERGVVVDLARACAAAERLADVEAWPPAAG